MYQLFSYLPPATGGSFDRTPAWNRFWYSESNQSYFNYQNHWCDCQNEFQLKNTYFFEIFFWLLLIDKARSGVLLGDFGLDAVFPRSFPLLLWRRGVLLTDTIFFEGFRLLLIWDDLFDKALTGDTGSKTALDDLG